ncbi:hypothetical protein PSCLAVI8L_250020 [Pseudoclavibacter sp. 8L]|nr:hypothetical protein PSCLAVI8L_250020 [Pseudoclavibacter sp. 8L]
MRQSRLVQCPSRSECKSDRASVNRPRIASVRENLLPEGRHRENSEHFEHGASRRPPARPINPGCHL